jgi:hypothetical protein
MATWKILKCDGCGKPFRMGADGYQRKLDGGQKRWFCGTSCSHGHPFRRQIRHPDLMEKARVDMASGMSWYESAKKHKVSRSTMRLYFLKLGYVPR